MHAQERALEVLLRGGLARAVQRLARPRTVVDQVFAFIAMIICAHTLEVVFTNFENIKLEFQFEGTTMS